MKLLFLTDHESGEGKSGSACKDTDAESISGSRSIGGLGSGSSCESAAEAEAGDRLAYVQRSRLHWRYMELMLHPDAEKAAELIAEVEGMGMAWREGRYHVDISKSDLNKGPGHWTYY